LNSFFNIFYDFFSLVFPRVCPACGNNLYIQENSICTKCLYDLPKTNFHLSKDNEVARLFWGRVRLEAATSYFFYYKGSRYQNIIHQLKYKGQKHIGFSLGRLFGADLNNTPFSEIEIIHPVPLHYKKLKRRGYNQSEYIALGISESLNRPVITDAVYRVKDVGTQTIKSRYERWENIEGVFRIKNFSKLENKHILIVDDVVTTGSTLEACASEILKLNNTKVSVATLVFARYG
jgi:ComF family protein